MTEKKKDAYALAGVNIAEGNKAVECYKPFIAETMKRLYGKSIGRKNNFCFILMLPNGAVLALSCDGVGTKLKIAIALGLVDTVGIDLVAMSVNDIVVNNVTVRYFMDYLATVGLKAEHAAQIIKGIAQGCIEADCALVGGETAEMPGFYAPGDFDLAGFAVGYDEDDSRVIDGRGIDLDMTLYGIASSGLHSNGYSLARNVYGIDPYDVEAARKVLEKFDSWLGATIGEELLKPTTIYVRQVRELTAKYRIEGMANITGGGFLENMPRMMPTGLGLEVNLGSWPVQPIFCQIAEKGQVSQEDMFRTFNNGIGFAFVSPDPNISEEGVYKIGQVVKASEKKVILTGKFY
jgi:phosphoribosylformylglycinamidine cyclo-ligase